MGPLQNQEEAYAYVCVYMDMNIYYQCDQKEGPRGGGRRPEVKVGRPRRGARSGGAPGVGGRRVRVECLLAPSRGGVLLLGETWSAELTLGDPCLL